MFEDYTHGAKVTISRQYFFGKGWKWKVRLGREKEKGIVDTKREARVAAASAKYRLEGSGK